MKILALTLAALFLAQGSQASVDIAKELRGDLVALDGKRVKRFDDSELSDKKYFALYFSAKWCPPCRAFTPKLVEWYNETKAKYPDFELIFVSSDKSEDAMEEYIEEYKMPWPALKFSKIRRADEIRQYAGKGIPCLVLLDAEGKVLSDSYRDGKFVGPSTVMAEADKILAGEQ